jgi:hypothetical protein
MRVSLWLQYRNCPFVCSIVLVQVEFGIKNLMFERRVRRQTPLEPFDQLKSSPREELVPLNPRRVRTPHSCIRALDTRIRAVDSRFRVLSATKPALCAHIMPRETESLKSRTASLMAAFL